MKKNFFAITAGMILLLSLTACGFTTGNSNPYQIQPQLTASGTGTVYMTPDIAYVFIGVQTRNEEVTAALTENNTLAANISKELQKLGVEERDIQTSAFNIYPNFEYSPEGKQSTTDYTVDNTIYVTVRDLSKLGKTLDAAVREGANTINGITYDVLDKEAAFTEARNQAIEKARSNAEDLAQAVNVKLGKLITINVYPNSPTTSWYDQGYGYGGGGAGTIMNNQIPLSSGQLILTINADIAYEIIN